jgi:hypothetical protein
MTLKFTLAILCLFAIGPLAFSQRTAWKTYSSPQGAFTVEFPGEPKVEETTSKTPEGYEVKIKMYSVQESGNVSYVLYNEMESGINILDDSAYLNAVTGEILKRFGRDPKVLEDLRFENAPGKHFLVEFSDGVAEGNIILRTNRAYFVVSFFPGAREADRKKFLNSFHFLPYQKMMSASYQSAEHLFKISFPAKPKLSTEQQEDGSTLHAYYALDPNSGNNYSVAVSQYSPYIQYKSDSVVLAERVNGYTTGGDSVIISKDVIVDGRPAKDLIIHQGKNNFKLRVRLFTNGYLSYTVFTFLPFDEIRAPHVNQFFDSFRFTGKVPGNLLSDKSTLMLKDIESNDTTVLNAVIPAIDDYEFTEMHVAKIQELLTKNFEDDADTLISRKITLLQSLKEIKSPTSVAFIKQVFPSLKNNSELEYNALLVLVELNSKEANDLLVELLPLHHAVKGSLWKYSHMLSYQRMDSAQAYDFFFKVLPLITAIPYKTGLYSSLQGLLREKRIQYSEVASYKSIFFSDFKSQYDVFANDTVYQFLDDLTNIISFDKPEKSEVEILKKLSGSDNYYLAIRANSSLLRLHQKVNEKAIQAIASNQFFRKDLFKEFKDFNLDASFPIAFHRQDSIAISELYSYVTEDYEAPTSMKIVHSEILDHKGEQKRFFVIQLYYADEELTYRAVAGPYSPEKIEAFGELTGSFFEENRDLNHHDYLLDYISQFE